MAILVTGGKGFISSRIIPKLVERKEKVVCLDLKTLPGRLGDIAKRARHSVSLHQPVYLKAEAGRQGSQSQEE